MGSVWGRLGAQVTVVEFLDRIVPTMVRRPQGSGLGQGADACGMVTVTEPMPMLHFMQRPLAMPGQAPAVAWQPCAEPQVLAHWHRAVCLVVQDGEIRKAFQRTLTKQGFKWKLGMKVL